MKSALGAAAALAVLAVLALPTATSASSLNLSWDRCFGDGNAYDKVFTCDTNQGTDVLVGSFEVDQAVPSLHGMYAIVDFRSQSPVLPSWWDFSTPGCRRSHMSGTFTMPAASSRCRDGWAGNAAGGIAQVRTWLTSPSSLQPNTMRVILACGVVDADVFTPHPGEEVFAFQLAIDHSLTTGPAACTGCDIPMCITFAHAELDYRPGGPSTNATLLLPNSNTQGWKSTVTSHGAGRSSTTLSCDPHNPANCEFDVICAAPTPAQNRTWGTIKSMYR